MFFFCLFVLMVFILHSSDDSMTQPGPVLSVLPLWPFIMCLVLYSSASVHFFVPLQYWHSASISPMSILSRWRQRHVTQIACSDVFLFCFFVFCGSFFCFVFLHLRNIFHLETFFCFVFVFLSLKKKTNKKNKAVCEHFPLLLAPERWHHVSCSVLRLSRC